MPDAANYARTAFLFPHAQLEAYPWNLKSAGRSAIAVCVFFNPRQVRHCSRMFVRVYVDSQRHVGWKVFFLASEKILAHLFLIHPTVDRIAAHRNAILAVLHTFKPPSRHTGTPENGYGEVSQNFPSDFGIVGRAVDFQELWLTFVRELHHRAFHGRGVLENFVSQSELVVGAAILAAV